MEERQPVPAEAIGFADRADVIDELELPLALQVLGAFAFRALAFVVMTAMAIWNESRPGRQIADLVTEHAPYIAWVNQWNYWIWIVAYVPWALLLLGVEPRRFVRLMIAEGILSLVRGVCIVLVPLGPVRGADTNLDVDWDWSLRWEVVGQIVDPIDVLYRQSAHTWLTKDLFFSGHVGTSFLLLLYVWPIRWLRWIVGPLHGAVVLSVIFGHVHYGIDVLAAWAAGGVIYAWREGHIQLDWPPVAAPR